MVCVGNIELTRYSQSNRIRSGNRPDFHSGTRNPYFHDICLFPSRRGLRNVRRRCGDIGRIPRLRRAGRRAVQQQCGGYGRRLRRQDARPRICRRRHLCRRADARDAAGRVSTCCLSSRTAGIPMRRPSVTSPRRLPIPAGQWSWGRSTTRTAAIRSTRRCSFQATDGARSNRSIPTRRMASASALTGPDCPTLSGVLNAASIVAHPLTQGVTALSAVSGFSGGNQAKPGTIVLANLGRTQRPRPARSGHRLSRDGRRMRHPDRNCP